MKWQQHGFVHHGLIHPAIGQILINTSSLMMYSMTAYNSMVIMISEQIMEIDGRSESDERKQQKKPCCLFDIFPLFLHPAKLGNKKEACWRTGFRGKSGGP
jgi:hypothetical protein